MAQAAPSTQVNGVAPTMLDQNAQAAFFAQLLQLRDVVLAEKHPRFKLPADVRQRLQSAKVPTSASFSGSSQQVPCLTTDGQQAAPGLQINGHMTNGVRNALAHDDNRSATAGQVPALKNHSSGIDPVLLTKSDDLIRAEVHLKRQRIEKQLRDNVDQRKQFSRRDPDAEPVSLIDLPEILQKAWDTVKPVSGLKPATNAQTAASDSFDENSYYSSQVNDWSSEASADNRRHGAAVKQGLASSASLPKHQQSQIERRLDPQALQPQSPAFRSPDQNPSFYTNDTETAYDAEREDSEEYSPPAAEAFSGADGADADAMNLDDGQYYAYRKCDGTDICSDSSEFVPEEPTIPSPQAPIITNNLMHIAAPQPARVSPLAVSKVPGLDQRRAASPRSQVPQVYGSRANERAVSEESTTSPRNSGQHSPAAPLTKKQRTRQRKRKREAEAAEKTRKRHEVTTPAKQPTLAKSPEPYIKPEPISPPPFANLSELQPAKNRTQNELPPDVEIVSPHEFRPRPRHSYYQEPPPPQPLRYGSPASPAVIRVASPASYGRPKRDDQDLRRVASLHSARRPLSPGYQQETPVYSPVAPYRTVSQPQPYLDPSSRPSYRMETSRAPSQYIRSERSLSPQLRPARDPYMQRLQSPALMAPPPQPRKIVVDQYGNRYVAADEPAMVAPPVPTHSARMSVAPLSRHEVEAGYERPPYERAPSRASVIYAPPQPTYDEGASSRMPPPPPMRRIAVQPEVEAPDYRAYRQRDYSRVPEPQYYREEPVYVREAMQPPPPPVHRGSVYPAEHGAPAGYARAYSVRPEAEAIRYVSRAPSVMPPMEHVRIAENGGPPAGERAVSVVPGPEYGRVAESRYAYGHGPAYPMAPPPVRYMEDHGTRGTAPPPQRVEIYVDQYGREVRRGPAYQ